MTLGWGEDPPNRDTPMDISSDDLSRTLEPLPLDPDPLSIRISDDEVRKLQKILQDESGREWSFAEARASGQELLDLTCTLMVEGAQAPPEAAQAPQDVSPTPHAFPIPFGVDHDREIAKNLAMLQDELRCVNRWPSHWRWALVALYDALGHALAKHRPASFLPYLGLGQLTRLFDAVAAEMPELPQVRASVEQIDRLRTGWIIRGPTRWPVDVGELPGIFENCVRVIKRLEPDSNEVARQGGIGATWPRRSLP